MNIDLIEPSIAAITEYSQTEAALTDLRKRMANVEYDVITVKGMEIAKKDRAEVRGLRTGLEAMRKQIKAPALAHCKLIDAEAARITTELLKLEEPIDQQIKAREAALEAEKLAREAAERARITAIHERIAAIRGFHALALECRTSERVDAILSRLVQTWLDFDYEEDFAEFGEEAQAIYNNTHAAVTAVFNQKQTEEDERARVKAEQQAAAAKLQAEREAHAVEAKKLADERAALEAERAAMAAERAEIAAKANAERLAQIAADQANQAAKELAEYQAAIAVSVAPAEPVITPAVEPVAQPEPVRLSAVRPAPSAEELITAIAEHFCSSKQLAAEWLDATDFSTYY